VGNRPDNHEEMADFTTLCGMALTATDSGHASTVVTDEPPDTCSRPPIERCAQRGYDR
jgi:hypothetical protein